MTEQIVNEIRRLEHERGRALVSKDWNALALLIGEDLVHVHANGLIEDKAGYLESARVKLDFLKVERVSFNVKCYGDIAVATGILLQSVRPQGSETVVDMKAATTQTWIRQGDRWLQNTFQATRTE
jgi:ketosteroid isomerase-like protein